MTKLKWMRSEDGNTATHCGEFMIEAHWSPYNNSRPRYYELWRHDPYFARLVRSGRFMTQRDAKAKAQKLAGEQR